MSIGDDSGTAYETMRGRDFPAIRQFTIFLENRVGQLLEVVKRFRGHGDTKSAQSRSTTRPNVRSSDSW